VSNYSSSGANLERSVSSPHMTKAQPTAPASLNTSMSESRLPPSRPPPTTPAAGTAPPSTSAAVEPKSAPAPAVPLKPPKPRPASKYHKMKPDGIDTAHVSKLFGQLNDFMAVAAESKELTPEEIEQMKQKMKADSK